MTGRTIVGQTRRLKLEAAGAMTLDAERHRQPNLRPKFVSRGYLAVALRALNAGRRMAAVVEKHRGLPREPVHPLPGDFLFPVEIPFDFLHLGAVCPHDRVAAHAEFDAGNRGRTVFLGSGVAEGACQFFFNVLPVAEEEGLFARARGGARTN